LKSFENAKVKSKDWYETKTREGKGRADRNKDRQIYPRDEKEREKEIERGRETAREESETEREEREKGREVKERGEREGGKREERQTGK